jgi:hypothetical protein
MDNSRCGEKEKVFLGFSKQGCFCVFQILVSFDVLGVFGEVGS